MADLLAQLVYRDVLACMPAFVVVMYRAYLQSTVLLRYNSHSTRKRYPVLAIVAAARHSWCNLDAQECKSTMLWWPLFPIQKSPSPPEASCICCCMLVLWLHECMAICDHRLIACDSYSCF